MNPIFIASIQSCSQVLLVCFAGYLAAKFEIITTDIKKGLSKLIIKIFLPCFLFANISYSLTIKTLINLWPIPAFFFIFASLSAIFGLIGGKLLKLNCPDTKFVVTGIILNNVTTLTLGLLNGIEKTKAIWILKWNENESPQDIVKRGTSYVLIVSLLANLLGWSLGAYLLTKVPEKDVPPIPQRFPQNNHSPSNQFQVNNDQITERTLLLRPNSHIIFQVNNDQITGLSIQIARVIFFNFKFMNPPLYAALLALIVITIPNSNYLFAEDDSPLMSIFQAIDYIGSIAIPLTLLTLGAQLYNLPQSRNENIASIIAYILTCRLLLMPIIGVSVVFFTTSYYIDDPMLWFVLILISSGPPAINCANLAQLTNNYQDEFSALLFYAYIFAIPFTTISVMFVLNYIKGIV
ncbi:auxin efflux carrier [Gigaspora margarita]|uniref:Auxin efflux carrier n=1 Tax=Gigaspora margarita TaxID=4874 RepID=A0A8H3XER5_GIGMA|nr:auxin efflux carrier [Gigaspora margarita]